MTIVTYLIQDEVMEQTLLYIYLIHILVLCTFLLSNTPYALSKEYQQKLHEKVKVQDVNILSLDINGERSINNVLSEITGNYLSQQTESNRVWGIGKHGIEEIIIAGGFSLH